MLTAAAATSTSLIRLRSRSLASSSVTTTAGGTMASLAKPTRSLTNTLFNSISYTYDGGAFKAGARLTNSSVSTAWFLRRLAEATNDDVGRDRPRSRLRLGRWRNGHPARWLRHRTLKKAPSALSSRLNSALAPSASLASTQRTRTYYYNESEWTVAASYEFKATDKLTITPAAQYFGDFGYRYNFDGGVDAWRVGLTAGYQITDGLQYPRYCSVQGRRRRTGQRPDGHVGGDEVSGFLRLQRDF